MSALRMGTSHMKELSKISTPTLIVGLQIFHHADSRQPREFDLLAFHGRRLIDDQHHAGALRRARRNQLRRETCAPADLPARPCDPRRRCVRRRSAARRRRPARTSSRRCLSAAGTASILMLLKTTSCVSSRFAGSVFDCTKSKRFAVRTSTMWPSVPARVFRNPLHPRAPHGDGVFETRFAQTRRPRSCR